MADFISFNEIFSRFLTLGSILSQKIYWSCFRKDKTTALFLFLSDRLNEDSKVHLNCKFMPGVDAIRSRSPIFIFCGRIFCLVIRIEEEATFSMRRTEYEGFC
jgi:hypothetical protein